VAEERGRGRRQLLGATSLWLAAHARPAQALGDLKCAGLRAYEMKMCLREARRVAEEAEGGAGSRDDAFLRNRQYEQPGELVVTQEGVQYREIDAGNPTGRQCTPGQVCEIHYTVYRLASGAYFKYSSGGTPVYLWSVGYGNEGKDDVGTVYRFTLGAKDALPPTVRVAMAGMREGGRRRVLVPPALGWANNKELQPKPDTFGAFRRLEAHKDEALLFEAELVRVVHQDSRQQEDRQGGRDAPLQLRPYQLPSPPSMDRTAVAPPRQ